MLNHLNYFISYTTLNLCSHISVPYSTFSAGPARCFDPWAQHGDGDEGSAATGGSGEDRGKSKGQKWRGTQHPSHPLLSQKMTIWWFNLEEIFIPLRSFHLFLFYNIESWSILISLFWLWSIGKVTILCQRKTSLQTDNWWISILASGTRETKSFSKPLWDKVIKK